MLHKLKIFLWCVLAVMLVSCSENTSHKANIANFKDTKGNVVTLESLKGKWVIVNYWAPWCEACIKEIPELNKFANHLAPDTVMYGVNFDQPAGDALLQAIKTAGITFPVLTADPGTLWHLGEVSVLPTTIIVNPAGVVVRQILGNSTAESLSVALADARRIEKK